LIVFEPKSSLRRDLFFDFFSNQRKNEQTNEKTERTKNRIVQVVIIVGGVSGRRELSSSFSVWQAKLQEPQGAIGFKSLSRLESPSRAFFI